MGAIVPLSEHASLPSEDEKLFFGDFCPESRILAPSSEESAPLSENS